MVIVTYSEVINTLSVITHNHLCKIHTAVIRKSALYPFTMSECRDNAQRKIKNRRNLRSLHSVGME